MEARGGEVRRIHVVYFLCRMGKAEQPHLVRVHHLNQSGVRLRDVKRWLGELRGKDMPDSFAWSYKRKYKTGCVWQDLLDDDLITPISDNEYYLKGSEISSLCPDASSPSENSPPSENSFNSSENSIHLDLPEKPCKMPPKSNAVNPIVKTVSSKLEDEKSTETDSTVMTKSSEYSSGKTTDSSRSWSLSSVNSPEEPKVKEDEHPKSQPRSTFRRSKSKTSRRIRNLLTCRRADTNESAIMQKARYESNKKNAARPIECKGEICKVESLGGPTGTIHRTWSRNQSHACSRKSFSDTKNFKKADDSLYKPLAEPNCSQCSKGFKPEKLHAHMKSCRGMKNRAQRGGRGDLNSTTRKPSEAKMEEPSTCLSHTKTEEQTTLEQIKSYT